MLQKIKPSRIGVALRKIREQIVADEPCPEQLTGLDVLQRSGPQAHRDWIAAGCPAVSPDNTATIGSAAAQAAPASAA